MSFFIIPSGESYCNDRHKVFRESKNIYERMVFYYGNYKNRAASCWQGSHRKSGDQAESPKVNLLTDIQAKLQAGKDAGYAQWAKVFNLKQKAPFLTDLLESSGEIRLTAEEHAAFTQYLHLVRQRDDMERKQIYFRGYTGAVAYLRKIIRWRCRKVMEALVKKFKTT